MKEEIPGIREIVREELDRAINEARHLRNEDVVDDLIGALVLIERSTYYLESEDFGKHAETAIQITRG